MRDCALALIAHRKGRINAASEPHGSDNIVSSCPERQFDRSDAYGDARAARAPPGNGNGAGSNLDRQLGRSDHNGHGRAVVDHRRQRISPRRKFDLL